MKSRILLIVLLIFSFKAHSGILIDPYVGYGLGGGEQKVNNTTNWDHDYSSPLFGGRLGFSYLGVMGGVDYSFQSFEMETVQTDSADATNNITVKDNLKKSQLGVFVGYEMPLMFRFWGTYFFKAEFEGDDANSTTQAQAFDSTDSEEGSGYGLGFGYTGLPYISLNFEYRAFSYSDWEDSNGSVTSGTFGNSPTANATDRDLNEFIFTVSMPLNIF